MLVQPAARTRYALLLAAFGNTDGTPALSIFVMEHLRDLTTRPPSRIPGAPKR
jgi:hypothetical protein